MLRKQSTMLCGGIIFAVLLCLKHIYLYLAPAYFVYLLRSYCLSSKSIFRIRFGNAAKLGTGILTIFGIAFGPFLYWDQMHQVFTRLFPFSRGLCHAYWAPNVWAIYSFTDRLLIFGKILLASTCYPSMLMVSVAPRLGLKINENALKSVTRGLIGDTSFAILPEIMPRTTFTLTLTSQLVRYQY